MECGEFSFTQIPSQAEHQTAAAADIKPPLPPFTAKEAALKVRLAEDAWNRQDPAAISKAYSVDSVWRNRGTFLTGRQAIQDFLSAKWKRELEYRLVKELWAVGSAGQGAAQAASSTHPDAAGGAVTGGVGTLVRPAESPPAPDLGHRIAVRFAYEYVTPDGQHMRAYGNENWEFNAQGLLTRRLASINDIPIDASERKLTWPAGEARPQDFPGLSELGL